MELYLLSHFWYWQIVNIKEACVMVFSTPPPPHLHLGRYIPPHLRNKDAGKNGKSKETPHKVCVFVSVFGDAGLAFTNPKHSMAVAKPV